MGESLLGPDVPNEGWTSRVLALARERLPARQWSLRIRSLLLSPDRLVRYCPLEGTVVDLACGHGLLSLAAAIARPRCHVIGVDHDPERIAQSRRLACDVPNVTFLSNDIRRHELPEGAAAIYLIDSLHYFAAADQSALLTRCWNALRCGGQLILREVVRQRRPAFYWTLLHELLMTGRLGFTQTCGAGLHFRDGRAWDEELQRLTDTAPAPRRYHTWLPYNDYLWVIQKTTPRLVSARAA